jgi:hypothetical protein
MRQGEAADTPAPTACRRWGACTRWDPSRLASQIRALESLDSHIGPHERFPGSGKRTLVRMSDFLDRFRTACGLLAVHLHKRDPGYGRMRHR